MLQAHVADSIARFQDRYNVELHRHIAASLEAVMSSYSQLLLRNWTVGWQSFLLSNFSRKSEDVVTRPPCLQHDLLRTLLDDVVVPCGHGRSVDVLRDHGYHGDTITLSMGLCCCRPIHGQILLALAKPQSQQAALHEAPPHEAPPPLNGKELGNSDVCWVSCKDLAVWLADMIVSCMR